MKKFYTLFIIVFLLGTFSAPVFAQKSHKTAVFAGGCFWCLEHDLEKLPGVVSAVSGYSGGHVVNPTYEQVSTGETGHREAVEVTYDPTKITYETLLSKYIDNIDPFDQVGQFCDKGIQYTAAIFTSDEAEKILAQQAVKNLSAKFPDQEIGIAIEPAAPFYKAEDYHQDYAEKNSVRYSLYRRGCGRDKRLEQIKSGT